MYIYVCICLFWILWWYIFSLLCWRLIHLTCSTPDAHQSIEYKRPALLCSRVCAPHLRHLHLNLLLPFKLFFGCCWCSWGRNLFWLFVAFLVFYCVEFLCLWFKTHLADDSSQWQTTVTWCCFSVQQNVQSCYSSVFSPRSLFCFCSSWLSWHCFSSCFFNSSICFSMAAAQGQKSNRGRISASYTLYVQTKTWED